MIKEDVHRAGVAGSRQLHLVIFRLVHGHLALVEEREVSPLGRHVVVGIGRDSDGIEVTGAVVLHQGDLRDVVLVGYCVR